MINASIFISRLEYNKPTRIPEYILEDVIEVMEKNDSQWYSLEFDEFFNVVKIIIKGNKKQKK